MRWFVSDTHFFHKSIIKFSRRPFKDVQEMNSTIIRNWNNRVSENEEVWFLGDLAFKVKKSTVEALISRLHGRIHFIKGNHDDRYLPMLRNMVGNGNKILSVRDVAYIKMMDGQKAMLCHYPMYSWRGKFHGRYHIYGHIHNSETEYTRMFPTALNVSVEATNYEPLSEKEVIERIKEREKNYENTTGKVWGELEYEES